MIAIALTMMVIIMTSFLMRETSFAILTINPESGNMSTWTKTEKHRNYHRIPFFKFLFFLKCYNFFF